MARPLKYPAETMAAAIEASRGGEATLAVVARLGVPEGTLRYWRRKAGLEKARSQRRFDYETVLRQRGEGERLIYLGLVHGVSQSAIRYALKHARAA
jgi:transposase-like protein